VLGVPLGELAWLALAVVLGGIVTGILAHRRQREVANNGVRPIYPIAQLFCKRFGNLQALAVSAVVILLDAGSVNYDESFISDV